MLTTVVLCNPSFLLLKSSTEPDRLSLNIKHLVWSHFVLKIWATGLTQNYPLVNILIVIKAGVVRYSRSFHDIEVFILLYNYLVRSQPEYGTVAWNSYSLNS